MKIKEMAQSDFWEMIKTSWTYNKLTEHEKEQLKNVIFSQRAENCLKGSYSQRWEILQAIYFGFLMALNYEPIGWRENETPKF